MGNQYVRLSATKALPLSTLKNTHFYPEKNSILWKLFTFVLCFKVPGERLFALAFCFVLMCSHNGLAQPWKCWKVPETLGKADWQIGVFQGIVLVSSSHSNFLFAYGSEGKLMWKREMNWPLSHAPLLVENQLLFQQQGQMAVLVQPETGETLQSLSGASSGRVVLYDRRSWIRLDQGGRLWLGDKQWQQWKSLGQIPLRRGDEWLGVPLVSDSSIYLATTQGYLVKVQVDNPEAYVETAGQLLRPLVAPVVHPDGILEVGLDGLLSLRNSQKGWTRSFSGWDQCFSPVGRILARPGVDGAGNIYMATRHNVCSWDRWGRSRWKVPISCASALVLHRERAYVADTSPAILELDLATGKLVGRMSLPMAVASGLTIEKSILAVVLQNGQVMLRSDLP